MKLIPIAPVSAIEFNVILPVDASNDQFGPVEKCPEPSLVCEEEVLDFYYGGRYFLGKKKVSDYSKFVLSLSKKILENSFVLKELYKER